MKSEKLYDGITEIRDETIERAENVKFHTAGKPLRRWGTLAAALVLVLGLGLVIGIALRPAGAGGSTGATAGGNSGITGFGYPTMDSSTYSYMDYEGPVLPLMALEATEIEVSRHTVLDFAPYDPQPEDGTVFDGEPVYVSRFDRAVQVTDSYVLKNTSAEDLTLTLCYPFAGDFFMTDAEYPTLTVDGQKTDAELTAGSYSGGFMDTAGKSATAAERYNLAQLKSWEDYRALLDGGDYLSFTLDSVPELTETVKVYRFYDFDAPMADEKKPNPSLQAAYTLDFEKATILSYGTSGGGDDRESGSGYRVVGGLGRNSGHSEEMLLIVLGEDIQNLSTQGFINSGCNPGDEIEVGCRVEVKEAELGDVLQELVSDYFADRERISDFADDSLLYAAVVDHLMRYGLLNENPAERYSTGMLEELMMDVGSMQRIFLLRFEVTIPAGGELELALSFRKHASENFMQDLTNGFDALRESESLPITEWMLELKNAQLVELVGDSLDGTLTAGEQTIPADKAHIWLNVIKAG